MSFSTIILAAGKGTRMKSDRPKVLHPLCGMPMIHYPLLAAKEAGAKNMAIVIGHGADLVREKVEGKNITFAVQEEQLGTGHAVMMCEEAITDRNLPVVILCGDAPLIRASTISSLVERHSAEKNSVTVLTACFDDPSGYGRIVKDGDELLKIVEEKDADDEEKALNEVNSGVYCVDGDFLFEVLSRVDSNNAQKEYYLTDIIHIGKTSGKRVGWSSVSDGNEIMGINSRKELALANKLMQMRILENLMSEGISIIDPDSTYIDLDVKIGRDSVIYPQVRLEGKVLVDEGVIIETGSVISNSTIGKGSHIKPYCVINDSTLGKETSTGPFAHLRPGAVLKDKAKAGNYVEIKKAVLGKGSKANHLTYIGNAEIGEGVNIGAGTVTCNYDGYNKSKTIIGDGAFIGSGTNLVAPVTIGEGAIIGAGSTITKDVAKDSLSLSRPDQKSIKGWAKKRRESIERSK